MTALQKTSLYIIAAMALLNMIWMGYAGFDIEGGDLFVPALFSIVLLAVSYFYIRYRPDKNLAAVTFWTALLIVFSVVAVISSYLFASLNGLILLTVPLEGNHYFADMLAGTLVAIIVWIGVLKVQQWQGVGTRKAKMPLYQPVARARS
ncbi:MAG: phosphatase PAP2 family protein [Hyphomicrobiaceae bacterium]|nr:phosphatase PAP2 family protein [Hyphomicrobiaceae bacterium]